MQAQKSNCFAHWKDNTVWYIHLMLKKRMGEIGSNCRRLWRTYSRKNVEKCCIESLSYLTMSLHVVSVRHELETAALLVLPQIAFAVQSVAILGLAAAHLCWQGKKCIASSPGTIGSVGVWERDSSLIPCHGVSFEQPASSLGPISLFSQVSFLTPLRFQGFFFLSMLNIQAIHHRWLMSHPVALSGEEEKANVIYLLLMLRLFLEMFRH